jgi:hypothetical protein
MTCPGIRINHELSRELVRILDQQPEFNSRRMMLRNVDGSSGMFESLSVAAKLVREARRRSPDEAAGWLDKVLQTKSAVGLRISTVWGLQTAERMQITDNVDLVPFESLPPSRQKESLKCIDPSAGPLPVPTFAWQPPTVALVCEQTFSPVLVDQVELQSVVSVPNCAEDFREIILCLSAIGPSVVVPGPSWSQFRDPDLEAAVIGTGRSYSHQEITPLVTPKPEPIDAGVAATTVQAYFQLKQSLRTRVRTAMERLQQAVKRFSPADRALEIAIALESLLTTASGEHTFKIALRAALLSAESTPDRLKNRHLVEAAYGLRSALTHSGNEPHDVTVKGTGKMRSSDVIDEVAKIVAKVIRTILSKGGLPDWDVLELSAGQVWGEN